jgi:hypothetical protein
MRIRVHNEKGVVNQKAGFTATSPGEYDFPDDPKYAGWLSGQAARGNLTIVHQHGPEVMGPTGGEAALGDAGKVAPVRDNPLAQGETANSGPASEAQVDPPAENPLAQGPTAVITQPAAGEGAPDRGPSTSQAAPPETARTDAGTEGRTAATLGDSLAQSVVSSTHPSGAVERGTTAHEAPRSGRGSGRSGR